MDKHIENNLKTNMIAYKINEKTSQEKTISNTNIKNVMKYTLNHDFIFYGFHFS